MSARMIMEKEGGSGQRISPEDHVITPKSIALSLAPVGAMSADFDIDDRCGGATGIGCANHGS